MSLDELNQHDLISVRLQSSGQILKWSFKINGEHYVYLPEGKIIVNGGHISNMGHAGELNETLVKNVKAAKGQALSIWLPDVGIQGNGHMMFFESNSDEIASLVVKWIEDSIG